MASLGSVWGTWFGAAGAALLEVEDGDVAFGWTLMGGNLGLLAGAFARPGAPLSRNRARLASIMGLAGGLAGVGLTLIMQPESDKLQIAIPLAGSIIGLAAGFGVTGDDRTGSRSDPDHSGPPGLSWELGGPVIPTVVDLRGQRRPALNLTLLSGRF
jgi:hypothetical protein